MLCFPLLKRHLSALLETLSSPLLFLSLISSLPFLSPSLLQICAFLCFLEAPCSFRIQNFSCERYHTNSCCYFWSLIVTFYVLFLFLYLIMLFTLNTRVMFTLTVCLTQADTIFFCYKSSCSKMCLNIIISIYWNFCSIFHCHRSFSFKKRKSNLSIFYIYIAFLHLARVKSCSI